MKANNIHNPSPLETIRNWAAGLIITGLLFTSPMAKAQFQIVITPSGAPMQCVTVGMQTMSN